MSWQTQAQTQSQEESVTGDLILTVNIEQLNNITGLYHVSFDFGGTPPDDASSCVGEVSLDMRFEFYSGTPTNPSTLLYTYDLTKTNGENIYFIGDSNDKDNFWHTDNLINDYVVYVPPSEDSEGNPCNANGLTNIEMSQIQFVKVVSSFHVGECWDTGIGNVSYSVNYEGGLLYSVNCAQEENSDPCLIESAEIIEIGTNNMPGYIDLDVLPTVQDFFYCQTDIGSAQIVYAVPYGGCPDENYPLYNQTWTYNENGVISDAPPFTPTNDWIQIQATTNPNSITSFVEVIAALPETLYDLTVSDNASNSINSPFTYTDRSDLIASIDIEQDATGCGATVEINIDYDNLSTSTLKPSHIIYYRDFYNDINDHGGRIDGMAGKLLNYITELGTYVVVILDESTRCTTIESFQVPFLIDLGGQQAFCEGGSVVLNPYLGNVDNYFWSNGAISPNIEVSLAGIYTVTVSINDCDLSEEVIVEMVGNPIVDLGPEEINIEGCKESPFIILEPIKIHSNETYRWSSGQSTYSITANLPATYILTVTNENGCTNVDRITVNLVSGLMVSIGENHEACQGDIVILEAVTAKASTANGDFVYIWSTGATTQSISVTQNGDYSVTVSNSEFCSANDDANVIFHDYPIINLGTDQFVCDASSTILDATINPETSYQWSTGATTSFIEVTEEGSYQVSVTTNGCTTMDNINVFFGDATADIQLTVADCNTGNTTLLTEVNPNFTYRWNTGSSQPIINITQVGTYTVTVTEDNCSVVDEITVSSESIGMQTAYTLSTDEVWTNQRNILGEMIVPLGKRLTIDGATINFMDENSGILVEEGGVLEIINRAVLRGSYCSANFWRGIIVAGDVNAEQPTTYLTQGSSSHGIVVIEGGSTIRDATIGIQTGNGIIRAVDANFIDNVVGISIGVLGGIIDAGTETQHTITGNNFGIETPIIISQTSPQYAGVQLFNVMDVITIESQNIFYNNDPNLIVQGIGNVNSIILCQDNIFNDLHTGINLSSTSNISLNLIYDNIFNNTEKGIMAVGGIGPAIERNQFNSIPMGTHSVDTYGAFCINNRPTIIDNNTFETFVSNNETKGLIIANTSDFVHIADNSFDGAFGAGTQFQGGNTNVLFECNTYTSAPKVDWYIAGNSSLNNQGDCEGFEEAPFALNNNWHAESTGYHIFRYNSNNGNLSIDHDPCSEPTLISPNVINTPCGFISEVACCAGANVEENPDDRVTISQNLNQLLEQGNQQGAINLLTQQQAEWADRLLVGTYLSLGDKTNAATALGRIPQNTPYNIAFHNMFNALINANPQLSILDEQMIRTYGQSNDLAVQSVAHSILASYFGESFTYTSAAVITSSNKRANPTFDESIVFSLNPNPSIYQLDINLNTSITNEKVIFTVYNVTGKIMQSVNLTEQTTSLDIVDLATGIYYCQVNFNDKVSEVQKLVIVR